MKESRVELKVCEACGSLWLRAMGQGVYCRGCVTRLSEFPAPRSGRRGRRCNGSPNAQPVTLPVVHAVAVAEVAADPAVETWAWAEDRVKQARIGVDMTPASRPSVEVRFYRKYTEAMLRRYLRMSMEAGRVPSLLGRELFRGNVTNYRVNSFEDVVAFCMDVERCLARLSPQQKDMVKRIGLQEYTQAEAAAVLGASLRCVVREYSGALDALTVMFLESRLLEPLKGCQ